MFLSSHVPGEADGSPRNLLGGGGGGGGKIATYDPLKLLSLCAAAAGIPAAKPKKMKLCWIQKGEVFCYSS